MPGWSALEGYLRDTAGALFELSLECLGGPSVAAATTQAGRAYGLTGLMRALPLHASQGRIYLPEDALLRHGTSPDAVLAGKTSSGLAVVLGEMRGKAQTALAEARHEIARLERPRRTAFLPLALVEPYLAALEKASRDPLHEVAEINPLYRLWRLARWEP
jgi:phytoene synthase